jgi:hypothetical protein
MSTNCCAWVLDCCGSVLLCHAAWAQSPVILQQPISKTVWTGCSVSMSVSVTGHGPFTYRWQFNGAPLTNGVISTVAGNGFNGYTGDGGPATNASLESILSISLDAVGNIYLPDATKQVVRRVDTAGLINSVAGGGTNGLGDGGPASNASLHNPGAIIADSLGNWFIPDQVNERTRKVDTNGIITTVAGTGTSGFSGDGGPATNAMLAFPVGTALDALGNLYIADYSNRRVRRVDTNGNIVTVAGDGTFGYAGDGGPATNASFYAPYRLVIDSLGNLFIGESSSRIRVVNSDGIIATSAGNGTTGFSGD